MPNRIIKESAFSSEKVAQLSDFEFRLWVGLITQADDMGRGDARPAIIKGRVFPLRDRVTVKDIDAALHGLAAKGCVSLYAVGGKPYFKIEGWEYTQPDAGRKTSEYRAWRKAVFERDNYTCQICGKRGGRLNAHHIERYRNCIDRRTDVSNGITLCDKCHKKIHHLEGK